MPRSATTSPASDSANANLPVSKLLAPAPTKIADALGRLGSVPSRPRSLDIPPEDIEHLRTSVELYLDTEGNDDKAAQALLEA
ncbi:unnamed protein product [Sympodiomycopsis kandeliae]